MLACVNAQLRFHINDNYVNISDIVILVTYYSLKFVTNIDVLEDYLCLNQHRVQWL